jgi:phage gp36-like protein
MPLLTIAQLNTHIYPGVKDLITETDDAILQDALDAAIAEAQGYLSRYRIEQLFDNVDSDPDYKPDKVLQMNIKHLAKWHFIVLANPSIDYEDAQTRYDQAIKWFMNIQNGKIVPPNWPPATPEDLSTFFHMTSNRKRRNHY